MKKIIIIKSAGNELANQLWNYSSVYAYTLERGYELKNPAFFEYGAYFKIPATGLLLKILFFLPFKNYTERKTAFRRKIWRKLYTWYSELMIKNNNNLISYNPEDRKPYYLPPTKESFGRLKELEQKNNDIYFDGWLFRNPMGLGKYRKEIIKYFQPKKQISLLVSSHIKNLRERYKNVVGVHIRQGDYKKVYRNGAYYIEQQRVREILDEYLKETDLDKTKTCFAITSDGQVDVSVFDGLNIVVSKENMVYDLFFLAKTDVILGSNSTFGAFASYYGNIPHIVFQKEDIDWAYYKDRKIHFQNKYCTLVHY